MVIWSGWGILTVAIAALVTGGVSAVLVPALDGAGMHRYSGLGIVAGLLAAAAANWVVGKRLNNAPGQELVDKATGRTVVLRRSHSLFFIRMHWWSVPLLALAAIVLFTVVFNTEGLDSGAHSIGTGGGVKRP